MLNIFKEEIEAQLWDVVDSIQSHGVECSTFLKKLKQATDVDEVFDLIRQFKADDGLSLYVDWIALYEESLYNMLK